MWILDLGLILTVCLCVYVPSALVALFKGMSKVTEERCEHLSYFLVRK